MKKLLLLLALPFFVSHFVFAQVGIGTSSPSVNSILELSSTNKGFLIPRITFANRPVNATGMILYQTDSIPGIYFNDGTNYQLLYGPSSGWGITGNSGTNSSINFIGTADNRSLPFRTDNIKRMVIDSLGRVGIGTTTPFNKLDVEGSVAIGSLFSGSSTAPTNSLIVQNCVNVGTAVNKGLGTFNRNSIYHSSYIVLSASGNKMTMAAGSVIIDCSGLTAAAWDDLNNKGLLHPGVSVDFSTNTNRLPNFHNYIVSVDLNTRLVSVSSPNSIEDYGVGVNWSYLNTAGVRFSETNLFLSDNDNLTSSPTIYENNGSLSFHNSTLTSVDFSIQAANGAARLISDKGISMYIDGDNSSTDAAFTIFSNCNWNTGLTRNVFSVTEEGEVNVRGSVTAISFIASTTGAGAYKYGLTSNMNVPDYVFDQRFDKRSENAEYKMLSLNELESYIQTNRHLPRVPSRSEIKADRVINLQGMSMVNLEKTEENTLYILELKTRLEEQNSKIEEQNSKIDLLIKEIDLLKQKRR